MLKWLPDCAAGVEHFSESGGELGVKSYVLVSWSSCGPCMTRKNR